MISYYLIIVFLEIRRSRGEQGIGEVFCIFSHPFFCFLCILDKISLLENPRLGYDVAPSLGHIVYHQWARSWRRSFLFNFSYQICFVFFASLIRFLCFRIIVGFRRRSLLGSHRIPSALLFEKHPLILLSGRWTFGTTPTTTSLQSPCLFTCNMRSCKRCCCARFRRFDLLSTLFANSQRWRVVFVSRSIVFAEAFMFHRLRLVSTLVFLVYYVTAICHVSVCSLASSLLLFSHLSHSFLLTPQCCRDLCLFLKSPLFVPFFRISLLAPLGNHQKTGFSKNSASNRPIWRMLFRL